jgi:uncharacterized protein (TIGR04222 family)
MTILSFFGVLDMRGPDFLGFYLLMASAALFVSFVIALVLPRVVWRGDVDRVEEVAAGLSPFDAAYLVGGLQRLMETAVTSLYRQKSIKPNKQGALSVSAAPKTVTDEVERDVYAAIRARGLREDIKKAAAFRGLVIRDRLTRDGMLLTHGQRWMARLVVALPLAAVLLLGIAKLGVGLSRDKPIGFLVVLCIFTGVAMVLVPWLVRKTGFGFAVVKTLQNSERDKQPAEEGVNPSAWTCALFGSATVFGAATSMNLFFNPPTTTSSGSGCSSDTGCGGGGCGGGCGGCGD